MKNRKIWKILTVLVSSAIILNSNLVFATKEITKQIENSETAEANSNAKEKVLKPLPLTKEERIEKAKEEFKKRIENWERNRKTYYKKREEFLNSNLEKFKNFNKENYEVPHYNLKVYFKDNSPILCYEHEITKTKVVIIPVNDEKFEDGDTNYYFRCFEANDKGLKNFLCESINSSLGDEEYKYYANFSNEDLRLSNPNKKTSEKANFLNDFFSTLKNPDILKNNEEFEKIKKKIIYAKLREENEKKEYRGENKEQTPYEEEHYSLEGTLKEIKNVTREEVEKFFNEKIHPSNLLITKKIEVSLNPEIVKNYLNILHEKYLNNFSYKKIPVTHFKKKKDSKNYEEIKFQYSQPFLDDLTGEEIKCKYSATYGLDFFDSNFQLKNFYLTHPTFRDLTLESGFFLRSGVFNNNFDKKFYDYVKKLGYIGARVYGLESITFFGNEKKLFNEETLKENFNKIIKFILKEIKNFNDEEIEKRLKCMNSLYLHDENNKYNPRFSDEIYRLTWKLADNFINFDDVFSKQTLNISNDNEIKDSNKDLIDDIKKDINSLNVKDLEKLNCKICVSMYDKNEKETETKRRPAYDKLVYFFPIEFKKNKNNLALEDISKRFLKEKYFDKKMEENNKIFISPETTGFFGSYIFKSYFPSEKTAKETIDFYLKDFEKLISEIKITKKDFEKLKERAKERFEDGINRIKNDEKSLNEYLNEINYYLKHGINKNVKNDDENNKFKITERTTRGDLLPITSSFLSRKKEEFLEKEKFKSIIYSKYGKPRNLNGENKEILIDKQYVEDLKKYMVDLTVKQFKASYNLAKKLLNEINNLKYEDFVETVKSASVVEKEEYEKDQQILNEIMKKRENLIIL